MLILASKSPRRAKILAAAGLEFEVRPTEAAEVSIPGDPELTVRTNALNKFRACNGGDAPVLAADTIVWFDGKIYGKPRDLIEAAQMLRELGGNTHVVYTGVAVGWPGEEKTLVVKSEVTFRPLSEADIAEYVALARPTDRAGAYDIDDHGERLVAAYTGGYENIMGLPLEAVDLARSLVGSPAPDLG
jgi:MAF protein